MKTILSEIFKTIVKKRNRNFDTGKNKIYKCVSPVISVGNLSVGGSGKTPFVQTLTNIIKDMGYKPGIVGKGYKRKSKGEVIVSDGSIILADAYAGGDEMLMLAESLHVPVIAHDLKYIGALMMESRFELDCLIIDDGFQHRQLFRDLDILLIDSETLEKPFLMPKGRLREPLDSMDRADVICFLGNYNPKDYDIENNLKDKLILNVKATHSRPYFMADTNKDRVTDSLISVSGIAKPKNFKLMLETLNYKVIFDIVFNDHHFYTSSDVKYIVDKCKNAGIENIAITEKDAVKLREFGNVFADNNIGILIFPIVVQITKGENELRKILAEILSKKR